jgi:hypothetical protein
MVLLASMTICSSVCEKLISTAAISRRGRRMRAVYCERRPWPHMMRNEPHIATTTNAASARYCTHGSSR